MVINKIFTVVLTLLSFAIPTISQVRQIDYNRDTILYDASINIGVRSMGGVTYLPSTVVETIFDNADYYVATDGDDSKPGTYEEPFATIQHAVDLVEAGDTVYIRGGVYYADGENDYHTIISAKGGSATEPICIWAYPGETPILDGSTLTSVVHNYGIYFTSSIYIHLKGLEIRNVPQLDNQQLNCGIYAAGGTYHVSNNIFENLNIHHIGGAGIVIRGDNVHDNLVKNCDVHHNYDELSSGDNADGIDIGTTVRTDTNTIIGCRTWYNSDDGIDFWDNEGTVIVDSCWSFLNGYIPGTDTQIGDGNGIKLGRTQEEKQSYAQRIIRNCILLYNYKSAINQNGALVDVIGYNNIIGRGVWGSIYLPADNLTHTFRNNISLEDHTEPLYNEGGVSLLTLGTGTHDIYYNSWNGSATKTLYTTTVPASFGTDGQYELGTVFNSVVDGSITGVRIYANASEGGDHVVRIWKHNGSGWDLVSGPYTWNITSGTEGWKTYTLGTPLEIVPTDTLTLSISNSTDHYYPSRNATITDRDKSFLNYRRGVYNVTLTNVPTSTTQSYNYFRDVVFTPSELQSTVSVTAADFASVDSSQLTNTRTSINKLPTISFMHLTTGSDLINAGIDVGSPYLGIKPDLGVFEKQ